MESKLVWNITKSEIVYESRDLSRKPNCYLFSKQILSLVETCNEITIDISITQRKSNNLIGVVGERGSGKSSFLKTARNILISSGYFVFEIIDPSIFDDSLSLLELFASRMYVYLTRDIDEDMMVESVSRKENSFRAKTKLISDLKTITRTLSNLKIDSGSFVANSVSGEILADISNRVEFFNSFEKLVKDFHLYIKLEGNYKGLVLLVDDLDMVDNGMTFVMLEDIQKYLSKNLILIISFRENQLINSITQKKIQENEILLRNSVISLSEIENQSRRYFEKILPITRCIKLNSAFELSRIKFKDIITSVFSDISEKYLIDTFYRSYGISDMSISAYGWIKEAIFVKTGIRIWPVDVKEDSALILPTNLRELLQLIEIIHEKMTFPNSSLSVSKYSGKIENVNVLNEYFIPYLKNKLPIEFRLFINEWENTDYLKKNYVVYEYFERYLIGVASGSVFSKNNGDNILLTRDDISRLIKINDVQAYNVTLGDVFYAMELFKKANNQGEYECLLVYIMKLLYTIHLLTNYLRIVESTKKPMESVNYGLDYNSIFMQNYQNLTRQKIIPEELSVIKSSLHYRKSESFARELETLLISDEFKLINKNLDNNNINETFQKIVSSTAATSGSIRKYGVKTIGRQDSKQDSRQKPENILFSYRPQYQHIENTGMNDIFDNSNRFVENTEYIIDIFTNLVKANYVYSTIYSNSRYIFYNLFDLDILIRINFSRQTERTPVKYAMEKLNNLFQGKLRGSFELDLSRHLMLNLGSSGKGFEKVFSDSDLALIQFVEISEAKKSRNTDLSKSEVYLHNTLEKRILLTKAEWVLNMPEVSPNDKKRLQALAKSFSEKNESIVSTNAVLIQDIIDKYLSVYSSEQE